MKNKKDILTYTVLGLAVVTALAYALKDIDIPFAAKDDSQKAAVTDSAAYAPSKELREIINKAEGRLDPRALADAKLEDVRKRDARPSDAAPMPTPLTDVAPPPPKVDVVAADHPRERLKRMNLGEPPQAKVAVKLPKTMNPEKPPAWTKTLAKPEIPVEAPNPFSPPPIKVNPERGQN